MVSNGNSSSSLFPVEASLEANLARVSDRATSPSLKINPLPDRTASSGPSLIVPDATYRLQLNREFTFKDATALIPYLARLGISHCYASPILKAREGSMHGYDGVDPQQLNPELGTEEEFKTLVATLKQHGMYLLLDIVPNHMGLGASNTWWMAVLEHGLASPYADYFDIDWQPLKKELDRKILIPTLGDQYGIILANGELRLAFGELRPHAFSVHYYDHAFPVRPRSYALLLKALLETSAPLASGEREALTELSRAFEFLPVTLYAKDTERQHYQEQLEQVQSRFAELLEKSSALEAAIRQLVHHVNEQAKTEPDTSLLHQVLEEQVYRLASWRVASSEINYRRFFDVNELIGLRTEEPHVFDDTHALILRWIGEGLVHGVRVDHPDGLYDPTGYFKTLQQKAAQQKGEAWPDGQRNLYVLAEKILAPHERLPENWLVHGTSGYVFINDCNQVLVDGNTASELHRLYQEFTEQPQHFEAILLASKQRVMKQSLASELQVLAFLLNELSESDIRTRDYSLLRLQDALRDIVLYFPVYRTYITKEGVSEKDRSYIEWAVARAKKNSHLPTLAIYDFIKSVLLQEFSGKEDEAHRERALHFTHKFQQFTGPIMAKSMEDTAFYRYFPLASLNEVGSEPETFSVTVNGFHRKNELRVLHFPNTLLASSTHDTKRSEDVRARINVLSELPESWGTLLELARRLNKYRKTEVEGELAPSRNDEYLIYQTLFGILPMEGLTPQNRSSIQDRLTAYLTKATREAKLFTSWTMPNEAYEAATRQFIAQVLDSYASNDTFSQFFSQLHKRVAFFGAINSLSQAVLKFTSPGVPDIYQGNELLDFSLVDPDNRCPVDFEARQATLTLLTTDPEGKEVLPSLEPLFRLPPIDDESAINEAVDGFFSQLKLAYTQRLLHYRKQQPALFRDGLYLALPAKGDKAEHCIAFARTHEASGAAALFAVPRLSCRLTGERFTLPDAASGAWGDTWIELPEELRGKRWRCLLTRQERVLEENADGVVSLASLLETTPWLALVVEEG